MSQAGTSGSSGTSATSGTSGSSGTSATSGTSGSNGAGGGGGIVLYMSYIEDTTPALTKLTPAQLTTITGQTIQSPTSTTITPTTNTDVSQLSLSPTLSDPQTTITFTTPNSATVDAVVVQFAINKSDLSLDQDVIPPGIWEMNIYAKADGNNDKDKIGLRFFLLARTTSTTNWTNLVANGSDLSYLYDFATSQVIQCNMYIQNPIDVSSYDAFMVVITSRNLNSSSHTAEVYFQSSNSYSHIHSSFTKPGPQGPSGPIGPTGPTGPAGTASSTIGPAEDGDYTDGIFTDFTPLTPIGTAIDRFNELFLLLAPAAPTNWNASVTSISFTNTSYSPRALTSGLVVSNMFTSTTPTLTDVDTVGTQSNAKVDTSGLTFSLLVDGNTIETVTLAGTSTTIKNTGNIRHSASGDPYVGVSGKAGFWTGITDFSLAGNLSTQTASSTQKVMSLYYPSNDSPKTFSFYVDSPLTPSITSITASIPTMSTYISGVPTLATGQSITSVGFTIPNVSSYFWAPTYVWSIAAGLVNAATGDPDSTPTSYGATGSVTSKTLTVRSGQFSDLSFSFTVTPRNSTSTSGTTGTLTSTAHRVDTVSNESGRLTSGGAGSYPGTGYGASYDSSQSLVGSYTGELQLRNGIYVYPTVNYTAVGGPNYSSASGTRWATFNIGTFTSNSAFTLNFIGSSGISTSTNVSNLLVEIKIDGASYWVDGDLAYSGVGNPGSSSDGVGAVVVASSSATARRITFGTATYTGNIIVRIGFTGTGLQFTSITATSIV